MTPLEAVLMKTNSVKRLTISALLIAMGIIIPMVMPRITIGPASFTLASHVPVFIAMFISPVVAIAVSLGTGFGFLIRNTDYCFAGLISFDFCSHWRSDFTKASRNFN